MSRLRLAKACRAEQNAPRGFFLRRFSKKLSETGDILRGFNIGRLFDFTHVNYFNRCRRKPALQLKAFLNFGTENSAEGETVKMKKILAIMLALVMVFALAACGEAETEETTPATEPAGEETTPATEPAEEPEEVSGNVTLNGSTSMESVILALIEGFADVQPGVSPNYTGSGSGAGIDRRPRRHLRPRPAPAAPSPTTRRRRAPLRTSSPRTASPSSINPENPVTDLTTEQVAKIYTGEITNWTELGGADAPIAVLGRDAASGTRGAFEEILGIEDACAYLNEYTSTGDVVGNVASNPNAIGYASASPPSTSPSPPSPSTASCPTEETVADGSFAIQRPFVIVTVEGTELSPAAQAFLDYAMSAEAAAIIDRRRRRAREPRRLSERQKSNGSGPQSKWGPIAMRPVSRGASDGRLRAERRSDPPRKGEKAMNETITPKGEGGSEDLVEAQNGRKAR